MIRTIGPPGASQVAFGVCRVAFIASGTAKAVIGLVVPSSAVGTVGCFPRVPAGAVAKREQSRNSGSVAVAVNVVGANAITRRVVDIAIGAPSAVCLGRAIESYSAVATICAFPHVAARAVAADVDIANDARCMVVAVQWIRTRPIAVGIILQSSNTRSAVLGGVVDSSTGVACSPSPHVAAEACASRDETFGFIRMIVAVLLRRTNATAVWIATVVVDALTTVLGGIVQGPAGITLSAVPLVSAGAITSKESVSRDFCCMIAAVRRYGARQVTMRVRIISCGACIAVLLWVVNLWAHVASVVGPLRTAVACAVVVRT